MDAASVVSGPGAWLRNPGQLPGASKHKNLLRNFTHSRHPGVPESSVPVKVLVRSLCRVSAKEMPWVGLGRRSGPPKNKMLLNIFKHRTPGPQNLSGTVESLVRSLCRVSARGVAWVSLRRPV